MKTLRTVVSIGRPLMRALYIFLLLVLSPVLTFSVVTAQQNKRSQPTQVASFPDNPCQLISAAQVSAVTGLKVTSVKRVPSLWEIESARIENREPSPGNICVYVTGSEFGDIMIGAPPRSERSAAKYWASRTEYFKTFPGSARYVAGVGMDAWLAGGVSLSVLVRDDEQFGLMTQRYQPGSEELLVKIAHVVLRRAR